MFWLNIIDRIILFLASCVTILSYIENKIQRNKKNINFDDRLLNEFEVSCFQQSDTSNTIDCLSNDILECFKNLLAYEKLNYYDANLIIPFILSIIVIINIIYSGIKFYVDPPPPLPCYYFMIVCPEPSIFSYLGVGLIIGIIYAFFTFLFIGYIFLIHEERIMFKIRGLKIEKKRQLLMLVRNHHWRYPKAGLEIEEKINNLILESHNR